MKKKKRDVSNGHNSINMNSVINVTPLSGVVFRTAVLRRHFRRLRHHVFPLVSSLRLRFCITTITSRSCVTTILRMTMASLRPGRTRMKRPRFVFRRVEGAQVEIYGAQGNRICSMVAAMPPINSQLLM